MSSGRRPRPVLLILVFALLIVGAFAFIFWPDEPELIGTDMEAQQAPSFTLIDHRGQTVSLEDFRGKATVLTFIFTNCPDVCPLVVNQLRTAYEELPEDKQENVALVAITLDPERDSVDVMREYSETRGVGHLDNWYALTADYETLEPIWTSYFVTPGEQYTADPEIVAAMEAGEHDHESFIEDIESGEYVAPESDDHSEHDDHGDNYWLAHVDVIYILDPETRVRVLLRSDAGPDAIAHNLRVLAP
jgi:protein SCO1